MRMPLAMSHMSIRSISIISAEAPRAPPSPSPSPSPLDYDVVVIMAAMLCALGLNTMLQCVVRCTRRAVAEPIGWVAHRRANAGLKREDVVALPVATYVASPSSSPSPAKKEEVAAAAGCAICLSEFADGERIRPLPVCGHRFHVLCIDRWLVSHCSCPTCRRRLSSESVEDHRHLQVLTAV
ncbi:hypothetical protein HU200_059139 [Digitaria exilis]|uniref:RING-type domain-containing protein n=1 Tax=Digitaria exilis TaxID=1010633 RepID=A0A835AES1_9POAL|nr:hypothetical protein HU200_059139 [Digitaria exilis]